MQAAGRACWQSPVAELHDCQARYAEYLPVRQNVCALLGTPRTRKWPDSPYIYLVQTMAAASRAFLNADSYRTRRDAEAFRRGFCTAVLASLKNALRAQEGRRWPRASSSRSLVLVKNTAVAEHFG